MTSYIAACFLLFFASTSFGAVDLNDPISTIVPQLSDCTKERAQSFLREMGLKVTSPIRNFVRMSYYSIYIRPSRAPRNGDSPIFRRTYHWDAVAKALAHNGLAFGMSDEEILAYESNELNSSLFKPLSSLVVTNENGRLINPKVFTNRGVYLIKDFMNNFDEEMRVPEGQRFRISYQSKAEMIESYKAAIDELLSEDQPTKQKLSVRPRNSSSKSNKSDTALIIRQWLIDTRDQAGDDAAARLACEVLLTRLPPDIDKAG